LFARIAANKASQVESVGRIEKQVDDLTYWRDQTESVGVDCEKEADELQLKLQKLESSIEVIEKFQSLTAAAVKWSLVAIGGGLTTLIFKVLYQAIKILP
jgi:DNA-dependent RNA polymerase auxiliary subunit epsilon